MNKLHLLDRQLIDATSVKLKESARVRMNYNLGNSENDVSQRMLNALLLRTKVPIHRHPRLTENIVCLCGDMDVILYKEDPLLSPLKGG